MIPTAALVSRRLRTSALLVGLAFALSGCFFVAAQQHYASDPTTRPWWCHSTGMGGHGAVPPYAWATKGMLSWPDCLAVSAQFDLLNSYVGQWPTEAQAEANGWYQIVGYAEGMGTHHANNGGFTPAILNSPGFDPDDPAFPGTVMDEVFNPTQPEFLMFANGNLVGVAFWVKHEGGPPPGFRGDNDWWHQHPLVCFNLTTGVYMGENRSDANCASIGGINVDFSDWYMLHAWVLPNWHVNYDPFAHHHPCLESGGPVTDPTDPCWIEAMHGGGH